MITDTLYIMHLQMLNSCWTRGRSSKACLALGPRR